MILHKVIPWQQGYDERSTYKEQWKFQTATDFTQKQAYFRMKKKPKEQRKSTSINLVVILKDYHSTWSKQQ